MIHIDHYAYQSKMRGVSPKQKMVFTLVPLLLCVFSGEMWLAVAVILIMGAYVVRIGGVPARFFLHLMLLPMTFLVISTLTVLLSSYSTSDHLLVAVKVANVWVGVSQYSLIQASTLFFRSLGAVSCLYALSLTTPMVAVLSTLRSLGLPVLITDLMSLIYRFIFVMMDAAASIITAQQARLGYWGWRAAYQSFGMMLTMLLVKAFKRSEDLYTALESRGYQGELTVLEEEYASSQAMLLSTVVINGSLAAGLLIQCF